jgi:hypothetical protein
MTSRLLSEVSDVSGKDSRPAIRWTNTREEKSLEEVMTADTRPQIMAEGIKQEKIRRAMLAGPCVTSEATVAELDLDGSMTVLRPGTNEWICVPGDQNIVGAADMCADPMGMVWMAQQCTNTRTSSGRPPDWSPVAEWPGGRPVSQWTRLDAGRPDDLGAGR